MDITVTFNEYGEAVRVTNVDGTEVKYGADEKITITDPSIKSYSSERLCDRHLWMIRTPINWQEARRRHAWHLKPRLAPPDV